MFCNSAVAASRYVAWVAATARSVAVTNTNRIFEIRLGLSFGPVTGTVHKKLQAMARWNSAFDSEFDHKGCISSNSDNGLIPANELSP